MLHVDDINDQVVEMVNHLLDKGLLSPENYVGYDACTISRPFHIHFGDIHVADIIFHMNERSSGEYDGLEGFDVEINKEILSNEKV